MTAATMLQRQELAQFLRKSDLRGCWILGVNWLLIAAAFALPALWPGPFTIVLALVLLGNRQLGLAVLMHECSHSSLFATRWLNKWVGHWLCGAPVLVQLEGYRRYHMKHHREAGTTDDPDYPNYRPYPVDGSSFRRKILRDLGGITGIRNLRSMLLMNAQLVEYNLSYKNPENARSDSGSPRQSLPWMLAPLIANVLMLAVLWISGHAWLYVLWLLAYLTSYMLISRIRNAAEHAAVPNLLSADPREHARTTYASWWERLTFAPNYVNYHMEHHLQPAVPCYRLPALHRFLRERKLLEGAEIASGYASVLRKLILPRAA